MYFRNFFKNFIIKKIYKGYKIFKKEKLLNSYYQLELDIEEYTNNLDKKDIIYNQFLIRLLLSNRMKFYYLFFLGMNFNLIFPIPFQWFHLFNKNKIKINYFFSSIFFLLMVFMFIVKSFLSIKKIAFIKNYNLQFVDKYDVIVNLNNNTFFANNYLPNNGNHNYNLIDYLIKEFNVSFNIYHQLNVKNIEKGQYKITYLNNFFPLKFTQKIFLLFYSFYQIVVSILKIFILNFNNIFLFNEIILSKQVELFNANNNLATRYFFIFPFTAFRPIWTYYAEKNGSNIFFINYASGFYGFKNIITNEYPIQMTLGLKCMTWGNYVVDKKLYFDFLLSSYPNKSFYLSKNPINISDSGIKLPYINNKKFIIGLFDITPIRKFLRMTHLPQDTFRETDLCIQFLKDIHELKVKLNLVILFKQKRKQIDINCKRYFNYAKYLTFEYVDPSVSSARVSNACDLLISTPFTTAAMNTNKYNKINSIFYSPLNLISDMDRASQNLPIIIGKNNLEYFIAKQIEAKFNAK